MKSAAAKPVACDKRAEKPPTADPSRRKWAVWRGAVVPVEKAIAIRESGGHRMRWAALFGLRAAMMR